MPTIEIDGVENVRDLGGIAVSGGRVVRPGLLYRGGNLSKLTAEGASKMADELGISLVIDLRVGWEVEAKPDIQIPGVRYEHIPFYDMEKVGIDYTQPAAGTKAQGHDIACDPDHFYHHMANELTAAQMGKAVRLILEYAQAGKAAYVHCSGGKDRAGIISLCLLTVLGASEQAILEDYLLTNVSRDARLDEMYQRFIRFTENDEHLAWQLVNNHRARPENLQSFRRAVDEHYGGMGVFVEQKLGLTKEAISQARSLLTL